MAVTLPRVEGAPLINGNVARLEVVLGKLLDGLGDGTAKKMVTAALEETGKKPPEKITGTMVSDYKDRQHKIAQYNQDWNSLDTKMSEIAENSAGVAKETRAAVEGLEGDIRDILADVKPKPSVAVQLSVLGKIDKAVEDADILVTRAHKIHDENSTKVPTGSGGSNGGGTSGGGGFPSFPGPTGTASPASYSGNGGEAPAMTDGEKVNAKQIYDYLIDHYGFTPAQAAGIIGNMQIESGFDTGAVNAGEGAIGLCQWEGGRRTNLENFAGNKIGNWKTQVDFMVHEMRTNESSAYSAVKAAKTPAQAAAAFDQYYERSSGQARGQRMDAAEKFANSMSNVAV